MELFALWGARDVCGFGEFWALVLAYEGRAHLAGGEAVIVWWGWRDCAEVANKMRDVGVLGGEFATEARGARWGGAGVKILVGGARVEGVADGAEMFTHNDITDSFDFLIISSRFSCDISMKDTSPDTSTDSFLFNS